MPCALECRLDASDIWLSGWHSLDTPFTGWVLTVEGSSLSDETDEWCSGGMPVSSCGTADTKLSSVDSCEVAERLGVEDV